MPDGFRQVHIENRPFGETMNRCLSSKIQACTVLAGLLLLLSGPRLQAQEWREALDRFNRMGGPCVLRIEWSTSEVTGAGRVIDRTGKSVVAVGSGASLCRNDMVDTRGQPVAHEYALIDGVYRQVDFEGDEMTTVFVAPDMNDFKMGVRTATQGTIFNWEWLRAPKGVESYLEGNEPRVEESVVDGARALSLTCNSEKWGELKIEFRAVDGLLLPTMVQATKAARHSLWEGDGARLQDMRKWDAVGQTPNGLTELVIREEITYASDENGPRLASHSGTTKVLAGDRTSRTTGTSTYLEHRWGDTIDDDDVKELATPVPDGFKVVSAHPSLQRLDMVWQQGKPVRAVDGEAIDMAAQAAPGGPGAGGGGGIYSRAWIVALGALALLVAVWWFKGRKTG